MFIKPTVFGTLRFFNTKLPDIQYKLHMCFPLIITHLLYLSINGIQVLATDEE